MQSLTNRWKTKIQNQSAQQLKLSLYTNTNNHDNSPHQGKEPLPSSVQQLGLSHQSREERQKSIKQDKNKNSRIKSSEHKKSKIRQQSSSGYVAQTPVKNLNKKQERLVESYANNILELIDNRSAYQAKQKIKAVLEDLIMNVSAEETINGSLKVGIGDRAYNQLETKYLQSEKERQYLKGKVEMSAKRYQSLERQLQRYGKMEKMIDSSINRENELRQQVNRLKAERTQLQSQMQVQNEIFSKEKNSILALMEELKMHLPIN